MMMLQLRPRWRRSRAPEAHRPSLAGVHHGKTCVPSSDEVPQGVSPTRAAGAGPATARPAQRRRARPRSHPRSSPPGSVRLRSHARWEGLGTLRVVLLYAPLPPKGRSPCLVRGCSFPARPRPARGATAPRGWDLRKHMPACHDPKPVGSRSLVPSPESSSGPLPHIS